MTRSLFFFIIVATVVVFLSCSKSDDQTNTETNKVLLTGTWRYSSSYRSDTGYMDENVLYGIGYLVENPLPQANYLTFNADGTAYSFQSAWGQGLSGALFQDTVPYSVNGNMVLLSYPAGINTYSSPEVSYPAYQDTILITSLATNMLTIKRKYHYKHSLIISGVTNIKQSVDTLTK